MEVEREGGSSENFPSKKRSDITPICRGDWSRKKVLDEEGATNSFSGQGKTAPNT